MGERLYLEIIEELSEEEELYKQPQILRLEVYSEEEAIDLVNKYKELFEGRKYVKRLHICRHNKSGNIPCEIKEL